MPDARLLFQCLATLGSCPLLQQVIGRLDPDCFELRGIRGADAFDVDDVHGNPPGGGEWAMSHAIMRPGAAPR